MSRAASSTIDHQALWQNTLAILTSLSSWKISPSRVKKIDGAEVVVGGFGDVRQATLLPDQSQESQVIALKVLRPAGSHEQRIRVIAALARELRVWTRLQHPNILTLLGFHFDATALAEAWIATPWQVKGNLLKYVEDRQITEKEKVKLVLDTLRGLEYLHDRKPPVCHGDIKAENTVIDAYGNAQLCDFGLAKILDDVPSGLTTTRASSYTIRYAAPEIIMGESLHTIASDMWAWGCLVLFIMTGLLPYHMHDQGPRIIVEIFQGHLPCELSGNQMHSSVRFVLSMCWKRDLGARLTIGQCRSRLNTWAVFRSVEELPLSSTPRSASASTRYPSPQTHMRGPIYVTTFSREPRSSLDGYRDHCEKKALLVGIQYRDSPDPNKRLPSSHVDVKRWKSVLIERYGYLEANIVCLLDAEGNDRNLWPSHDNIVAQMRHLVAGTSKGDQRFFFVAGHDDLDYSLRGNKLNGKDTAILTSEYGKTNSIRLLDSTIRREMVEPLRWGASLIAVVDACHSGTILDLPYEVTFDRTGVANYTNAQINPLSVKGDVLCVSSCRDEQSTINLKKRSDPTQQAGLLTTLILWYLQNQGAEPWRVQDLESRLKQALGGRPQTPMITCGSKSVRQDFDL